MKHACLHKRITLSRQATNTSSAKAAAESNGPLLIGCANNFGQHFNGVIDKPRFYNRALNKAEIEADKGTGI